MRNLYSMHQARDAMTSVHMCYPAPGDYCIPEAVWASCLRCIKHLHHLPCPCDPDLPNKYVTVQHAGDALKQAQGHATTPNIEQSIFLEYDENANDADGQLAHKWLIDHGIIMVVTNLGTACCS